MAGGSRPASSQLPTTAISSMPARIHTGLGLSIAQSVLTAHHATVTARSQPAGGLDTSVVIPRDPRRLKHPDRE